MNYNCSSVLDLRNLQEQVKKAFCYQKLFWPFTVWINCSSDLKNFANSRPSCSNFKSFSRSLEQFFLTVGQNNFGNKIPFLCGKKRKLLQFFFFFLSFFFLNSSFPEVCSYWKYARYRNISADIFFLGKVWYVNKNKVIFCFH